ncbi:hypothetical protein pb186bvf_011774 [Paramecium bursaria]
MYAVVRGDGLLQNSKQVNQVNNNMQVLIFQCIGHMLDIPIHIFINAYLTESMTTFSRDRLNYVLQAYRTYKVIFFMFYFLYHMFQLTIISVEFPTQEAKRDIYVKVIYQGQTQQTKVDMDTIKNAKWDQSFQFKEEQGAIQIQLLHWVSKEDEKVFAEASLTLDQCKQSQGQPLELPLESGKLLVRYQPIQENSQDDKIKQFQKYLHDTGLESAFKLIFAEILTKKIDKNEAFTYAAMRLRQMGEDLKMFFSSNHKMSQLLNNISEVQQEEDDREQFLESGER